LLCAQIQAKFKLGIRNDDPPAFRMGRCLLIELQADLANLICQTASNHLLHLFKGDVDIMPLGGLGGWGKDGLLQPIRLSQANR